MKQTILITGASSGFGQLIAKKLYAAGYNVIGTSRNPERIQSSVPYKIIALDLDSEKSINTFPERVFKEIDHLDTLRSKIEKFTNDLVEQAEDPEIVVKKVLEIIKTEKPKFRNIVGKGTSTLINLQHFAYEILEKNILKQLNK